MPFDLNKCVSYISIGKIKGISEAFGKWLVKENITRIQWIALYYIYTQGKQSQRDLSNHMKINDSSAMRLIGRMERDGWVERQRSEDDRRIILLSLTESGRELITRALPVGEDFSHKLIEGIDPEEIKIFLRVQQQMYDNIMNDPRSQE